jgi:predicted nucleic acid-binding protein
MAIGDDGLRRYQRAAETSRHRARVSCGAGVAAKPVADGELLVSSSLAWLEVWRALRRAGLTDIEAVAESALSGIAEFPLDEFVLLRARRVGEDQLRSLDAIHLAAAIAVGADSLLTYDERLASSANAVGLNVLAPVV